MKSRDQYILPGRQYPFSAGGRQYAASRQVQYWTRNMQPRSGSRRDVISRRPSFLPAFSSKGVRWDALVVIVSLLLVLLTGILLSDIGAIRAGGDRIGYLSAGIVSLEGSNNMLQSELSMAMRHPVLQRRNELSEAGEDTVITISAAPLP